MKKFIISLLMVLAAVFCIQAGTLGDVFNTKVRPGAMMIQEAPAEELKNDGLTAAAVAMLDAAGMEQALAAIPEDLKPVFEEAQGGGTVKAYMVEAGNDSEILILVNGGGQYVVVYAQGPAEAVAKMLQQ